MLPFLKRKPTPAPTVVNRKPDEPGEPTEDQGLSSCARDLIEAVHNRDEKGVAAAIKAAFEICETYPHEETHEFEMDGDTE